VAVTFALHPGALLELLANAELVKHIMDINRRKNGFGLKVSPNIPGVCGEIFWLIFLSLFRV